jgi:hypothetical protein
VPSARENGSCAPAGISVDELARRVRSRDPGELAAWLTGAGFADDRDGLLHPTPLALELGDSLDDVCSNA